MKSSRPKVLHEIAGRSMLAHVLTSVAGAKADSIAVVVGPGREDVRAVVSSLCASAEVFVQEQRLGTAHAVLAARDAIARGHDDILVLFADTPLVTTATILALRAALEDGAAVAALGFEAVNPFGYGRLIRDEAGRLAAIREEKDASDAERAITLCNAGLMAIDGRRALELLRDVGADNAKGEYYLTDIVEFARAKGLDARVVVGAESEVLGVNDRAQLAQAERIAQDRLRRAAMLNGATLIAPETVFLNADTKLGRDVLIEPHVVFGPRVEVADGAHIYAFSRIEGARIGAGAHVGPFARLRPGTNLGPGAKVGNFVEIKSTTLGAGAKVSHLTYLGDAEIGADANIGAGTITCNYDGVNKHKTIIEDGVFVGSDSTLVAPIKIGHGAYVAAGSSITEDVPADSLAFGRARQSVKEGWAKAKRDERKAKQR